ncbi:uncharacterized protein LOC131601647 [Vicia villosa]|uniref:uncharacterized protein LOC131601647 n=1 Tax=Vicia villosa TaxID=3911 RepID=UPI00273B90A1|nr:uncharacterized protein LOC131601647 [Vicia villosa]
MVDLTHLNAVAHHEPSRNHYTELIPRKNMASLGSTSTYLDSSSRLLMDSFKEIFLCRCGVLHTVNFQIKLTHAHPLKFTQHNLLASHLVTYVLVRRKWQSTRIRLAAMLYVHQESHLVQHIRY